MSSLTAPTPLDRDGLPSVGALREQLRPQFDAFVDLMIEQRRIGLRSAEVEIESLKENICNAWLERDEAKAALEQEIKARAAFVDRLAEANKSLHSELSQARDLIGAERVGRASLVENVRQLVAEIEHLKAHPWIHVTTGHVRRVMVDLETFGTRPGAVIVALGAVRFEDGKIVDRFYARIDPVDAQARGLSIDAATVVWWLEQSAEARIEITGGGGKPLANVLGEFGAWLGGGETEVWGNGASFDNVLLDEAFARCGLKRPWPFWMDRCYRTVKTLRPDVKLERKGTHHNALDDAESQALHLMAMGVGA